MTVAISPVLPREHDHEVTLPCILSRLSRLEEEEFSYKQLLQDFAERRRLGPLSKSPRTLVDDPVGQAYNTVQVYNSS